MRCLNFRCDDAHGFRDDQPVDAFETLLPMNLHGCSTHLFNLDASKHITRGGKLSPQLSALKFLMIFGLNKFHKGYI